MCRLCMYVCCCAACLCVLSNSVLQQICSLDKLLGVSRILSSMQGACPAFLQPVAADSPELLNGFFATPVLKHVLVHLLERGCLKL